jgi:hypothetical protein
MMGITEVLSLQLSGGTEVYQIKFQSGYLMSQAKFDLNTNQIQLISLSLSTCKMFFHAPIISFLSSPRVEKVFVSICVIFLLFHTV